MSQAKVDLVRAQFEAFERGGYEAVAEYYAMNELRAILQAFDGRAEQMQRIKFRRLIECA